MPLYNTFVIYTGMGSVTDYAIPFPYFDVTDVVVVRGGGTVTYSFPSANVLRLSAALATGDTLKISRVTSLASARVVFQSGSSTTASQLNTANLQLLYGMQEAIDNSDSRIGLDSSGRWDALAKRILNVADPTGAQDAATKNYVDTGATSQLALAIAARAAADADVVLTHADVVLTHADVVLTHADAASTAADRAVVAADKAIVIADLATVVADLASVVANKNASDADVVLTHADVVLTHADASSTAADRSTVAADKAIVIADMALTHADVVLTHADAAATAADRATVAADKAIVIANLATTAADLATVVADTAAVVSNAATVASNTTAAAGSATAAAGSATAAAGSATNASGSASTASTQASNAVTSATAATTSATAAATSASGASSSATAAASSATSASGSATTATTQAGNASTSATGAATSSTAAASSATAAATSASSASTSASTATTQASTATTQAGNASTSATAAAGSATASASSATAAAGSATLAAGYAVGGLTFIGNWDASAGTFPGGGTAPKGAMYRVSVQGTVNGIPFAVGDNVIAIVLNPSTTTFASNWVRDLGGINSAEVISALGYTPLNPANNLSDVTTPATARVNLGLGTAATLAATAVVQVANNLSDVTPATARTNLAVPVNTRLISAGGLATGGGDLTADRTITVPKSTNPQATAGTDDTTAMTPLRVADAIAALAPVAFPSGTRLLFQQTAAPTGWTKVTTYNDVGMRIVSGTVGAVTGATAFSTVFSQTTTGSHSLTALEQASMPVTGTFAGYTNSGGEIVVRDGSGAIGYTNGSGPAALNQFDVSVSGNITGTATGGGGGHTHAVALNLNYVDVIIASKN